MLKIARETFKVIDKNYTDIISTSALINNNKRNMVKMKTEIADTHNRMEIIQNSMPLGNRGSLIY